MSHCPICQRELTEADAQIASRTHCDQAQASLWKAQTNGSYADYNRAVFGFDEALKLNDRNETAREELRKTKKRYAEMALHKGDLELGLAVANPIDPDHASVIAMLRVAQHERDTRSKLLEMAKRGALAATVVFVVGVSVAMVLINAQKESAMAREHQALITTEQARDEALRARQAEQLARQQLAEALAKP